MIDYTQDHWGKLVLVSYFCEEIPSISNATVGLPQMWKHDEEGFVCLFVVVDPRPTRAKLTAISPSPQNPKSDAHCMGISLTPPPPPPFKNKRRRWCSYHQWL